MLARHFADRPIGQRIELPLNIASCYDIELLLQPAGGPYDGIYYLREIVGDRIFSGSIGYIESAALYRSLASLYGTRPSTYAAFSNAISALGGKLNDIIIDGYTESESAFHSALRITSNTGQLHIDVRPSDALNLAIMCNVPIFVSEAAWRMSHYQRCESSPEE